MDTLLNNKAKGVDIHGTRGGSMLGRAGAAAPAEVEIAQVLPFFSGEIMSSGDTPRCLNRAMAATSSLVRRRQR
jgi:hypothetical protein